MTVCLVEKELFRCESELQCLVDARVVRAGCNWLGVHYQDVKNKELRWDKLLDFFQVKDTLFNALIEKYPKKEKFTLVSKHVQTVVFTSLSTTSFTLQCNNGCSPITCMVWSVPTGECYVGIINEDESTQLQFVSDLFKFLCFLYPTLFLSGSVPWNGKKLVSEDLSGSLIQLYGEW
jgi:hypothetical protein